MKQQQQSPYKIICYIKKSDTGLSLFDPEFGLSGSVQPRGPKNVQSLQSENSDYHTFPCIQSQTFAQGSGQELARENCWFIKGRHLQRAVVLKSCAF